MAFRLGHLMRLPVLLFLLLAACSWNEPREIDLPREIDVVAAHFVTALQKGNRAAAERGVAPTARDELAAQFARDHDALKSHPPLTPRFITYKPRGMMGPNDSEATVIYAAQKDGKWATLEIRLFRLGDEPYEVDYWKLSNEVPVATSYTPELKPLQPILVGVALALVVLGTLLIGIVIWLVRRKPHIMAPENATDHRTAAVTTREEIAER